jgi:outer membrane protein OmpA-like peptidoglycan-associated protein
MVRRRDWKGVTLGLVALGLVAAGSRPGAAQEGASSPAAAEASAAQPADTAQSPEPLKWGTGAWMFNAYVGQFNDLPEWRPDHLRDQLRRDALFGGRIGYNSPFNLFVQAEASNTLLLTRLSATGGRRNTNLFLLGGALGFNIQPRQNLQLVPLVGIGAAIWRPDGIASETDFTVEFGGGVRYFVNPKLAVRGDLRWHAIPNAMQNIRDRLAGTPVPHPTMWGAELSGGMSLLVGGLSDRDRDNVNDAEDACPDTPRGTAVDRTGCPLPPGIRLSSPSGGDTLRGPKPLKWGTGAWFFNAYAGLISDEPAWDPDHVTGQLRRGALFGGRVGYIFPSNLILEAQGSNALLQTRLSPTDRIRSTNLYLVGPAVGYNVQPTQKLQLFPMVGVGAATFKPDSLGSETQLALDLGGGFRYFVSPKLAVRGDLRWHQIPNAMRDIRDRLAGAPVPHPTLSGLELSAGLSLSLGGPSDADRDNVADDQDACPNTPWGIPVDLRGCSPRDHAEPAHNAVRPCPNAPPGAVVDATGCPRDSDGDRVYDGIDQCPNTPPDAIVDGTGCPLDSDGDRVYDGIDQCPNTPPGAIVDATGCPLDSDGDRVYDGIDQCPNTLPGVVVDATGCPLDSDGDGIPDGIDRCPNTPPGQDVDDSGCPPAAVIRPNVPLNLDVHFDFDRATLRPGSSTALDSFGRGLSGMPGVQVEIQGYTDSVGPADYNLGLSRRRAEAVRDYLLRHFPRLDGSHFTVRAFGESDPVASNATAAGRERNRRVIVIVHDGSM